MSKGWISLHRKIVDSPVFADSDLLKLWVHCLLKATHTDYKQLVGKKVVELSPGQFLTGREALANEYNKGVKTKDIVTARTLWRWMKLLEELEMLSINSSPQYSVVTITKWHEHQDNDQRVSNECPTNVQRVSTNNNSNNSNNNNKKESRKRVYDESSIHFQLADRLYRKILENNENHKKPDLQSWANDIRLMMERDNRTEKQIMYTIDWCQNHDFWKSNILSVAKLREKFDQLVLQIKRDRKKPVEKPIYESSETDARSDESDAQENGHVRLFK